MASLNTLRTKFGWFLSILIAIALLAFIVTLDDSWLGGSRDPKVGEMGGDKIKYTEYQDALARMEQQAGPATGDAARDQMAAATWTGLIAQHVYLPGFEKMGLRVTPAERSGLISGEYFSPVLSMYFTNPQTGAYDTSGILAFMDRAKNSPELEAAWSSLMEGAIQERQSMKYGRLVESGLYANRLEVAHALVSADKTFSGFWAGKRYTTLADSLFQVSDAEVESYYQSHKARYRRQPSRTVTYVRYELKPSALDKNNARLENEKRAATLAGEDLALKARIVDSLNREPAEISSGTRREIHNRAGSFAGNAKGSADHFIAAAQASELTTREAVLYKGDREVQGMPASRELARWIYNAEIGEVSPVVVVGEDYVVAILKSVDESEFAPLEQVAENVRHILMNHKKYEQLAASMAGKSLEQVATDAGHEPVMFEGVTDKTIFIAELGIEPRVVGAILATVQPGAISKPVRGDSGVYVFVVDKIAPILATPSTEGATEAPESIALTPEAERLRLETEAKAGVGRQLMSALEELAEVKDFRAKYF